MMTVAEWYAQHPPQSIIDLAKRDHDPLHRKPWVVLAYRRTTGHYARVISAGYNRWTGHPIGWIVPDFNDPRYDISNAVEVTA